MKEFKSEHSLVAFTKVSCIFVCSDQTMLHCVTLFTVPYEEALSMWRLTVCHADRKLNSALLWYQISIPLALTLLALYNECLNLLIVKEKQNIFSKSKTVPSDGKQGSHNSVHIPKPSALKVQAETWQWWIWVRCYLCTGVALWAGKQSLRCSQTLPFNTTRKHRFKLWIYHRIIPCIMQLCITCALNLHIKLNNTFLLWNQCMACKIITRTARFNTRDIQHSFTPGCYKKMCRGIERGLKIKKVKV